MAIPRPQPGSYEFFGHRRARGSSTVAPNEQTGQTSVYKPPTDYGGGYFPTSGAEMGQHAGWQTFKEKGFGNVGEAAAVTQSYFYDYGVSTASLGIRETDLPVVSPESQTRYNGGQGEGRGLLQSPERSVFERREIFRKPVPGQRS